MNGTGSIARPTVNRTVGTANSRNTYLKQHAPFGDHKSCRAREDGRWIVSCRVDGARATPEFPGSPSEMQWRDSCRCHYTWRREKQKFSYRLSVKDQVMAHPFTILSVVLNIVLISLLIAWSVRKSELCLADPKSPEASCPDGWVGYRGKCYYFSEAEGNWTYSRSQCSSLNASLAGIDTQQEKVFMIRYKGLPDHWISFWREPNGTWKWANGTDLNNGTEEMERVIFHIY
ncbi:early activation antigen CD69-like isoform X2 [Trachemys scripta elegans]|uniref:early activation antigen CD69-like isoform X2 n=1 Tax=Trachemys scripta elegans TaxID=31138 RepID=UPI0015550795|nr:early activation antigen CD69-like isoform X2 [Trachemys scripta elegans]